MDRRNDVINEALAEEVRRAQQRKRKDDDGAATVLVLEPATLAARDQRESPVEPDPDPKRRLIMKSAPSAASQSGQQREKSQSPTRKEERKPEVRWRFWH